jgi:Sec-independent protein secretion pathway component TatC
MMGVPMYLLYEAALLIVQMLVRSRPDRTIDA